MKQVAIAEVEEKNWSKRESRTGDSLAQGSAFCTFPCKLKREQFYILFVVGIKDLNYDEIY